MTARSSRAWKIASAAAAALVVTLVFYPGSDRETPPAVSSPLVVASPSRAPLAAFGTPRARSTPAVFDLAAVARAPAAQRTADQEPVPTTEWFTEEDLRHPERYFELAERMPELNRPEERRDTLAFFARHRERLQRDLERAADTPDERREIEATIARYDAAIARLRALLDAAS